VLNGTPVDGLAREITQRLRRRGVDVVFFGSAPGEPVDSTQVIVRRGEREVGLAVQSVLGFGRVVVEPDPRLLLDVSIVLGADAAPHRDP
jgi:chemotaxis protein histidine kinase CheA